MEQAYRLFVPSSSEMLKLRKIADEFMSILMENASDKDINVNFKFSGSYAKGTWIKGESDIDILGIFEKESEIEKLENLVPDNFVETFGTRKYFRGYFKNMEIEVVPVVKFSDISKVKNSIDLSVLHADYINSKLSPAQKMDVIILKALCKANNCYGSETYMRGFSGYVLEVLIDKFGSLKTLAENVEKWDDKVFLDNVKTKENYSIFLSDPTNPSRNICASVSSENLSKFVFSLKLLKAYPNINLFLESNVRDIINKQSRLRGAKLFTFTTKIKEPKDIFLSKYVKNVGKLIDELKRNDISIYSADFDYSRNEAKLFIQIANFPRTATRIVYGPSAFSSSEILENFLKSHKNVFVSGNRLAYDKAYGIKDFNKFILIKIKEYMSQKSILDN